MSVERLNHRSSLSKKELNAKKTRRWLWMILAATLIGGGIAVSEAFEKKEYQPIKFKPVPKCRECGSSEEKKIKPREKKIKPYKRRKRYNRSQYA